MPSNALARSHSLAVTQLAVTQIEAQDLGLLMLYIARCGQRPSKQQIRFEKLTLYTAVICPLFLWHGDPDGRFTWFNVSERFVFTTPRVCLPLVRALYAAVPCAYAAAEFCSWWCGAAPNRGKLFVMRPL